MNELFLAWLAGFIDGEGHLSVAKKVKRGGEGRRINDTITYNPELHIAQTDRTALDEIVATLGVGGVFAAPRSKYNPNARDGWQYRVSGRNAIHIVSLVRPYLRVKQAQADALMSFPFTGRGRVYRHSEAFLQQGQVFDQLRTLNATGNGLPRAKSGRKPKVI